MKNTANLKKQQQYFIQVNLATLKYSYGVSSQNFNLIRVKNSPYCTVSSEWFTEITLSRN